VANIRIHNPFADIRITGWRLEEELNHRLGQDARK
jgi:hypothetical protein